MLRDRYVGLSHPLIFEAEQEDEVFVRGDVQVNTLSPRANGRQMTAVEVVAAFGPETLSRLREEGVAVLQARPNASSLAILERLSDLNITVSALERRLGFEQGSLEPLLDGKSYIPIRQLELINFHLGMDDGRISADLEKQPIPRVRLRYYDKNEDEHSFSTDTVFSLAENSWRLQKLSFLEDLISCFQQRFPNTKPGNQYVTAVQKSFSIPHPSKTAIRLGEELAARARKTIPLTFREGDHVALDATFDALGINTSRDLLPAEYSGMTIINPWDDTRAVVANTVGKNSTYEIMRFTLAHELGHALGDSQDDFVQLKVGNVAGSASGSSTRQKAGRRRDLPEIRANSFAINFLLPLDKTKEVVNSSTGLSRVEISLELAQRFGISQVAAGYRLQHLDGQSLARGGQTFEDRLKEQIDLLGNLLSRSAQQALSLKLITQDTFNSIFSRAQSKQA